MPPRNPSELERQDSMVRELSWLQRSLREGHHSKSTKECILREIRKLEDQLDLEHVPYNKG